MPNTDTYILMEAILTVACSENKVSIPAGDSN